MRNYEKYAVDYLDADNTFEHYAVKYRREVVLSSIKRHNATKILEIGCGAESIFEFLENKQGFIIEPSNHLLNIAKNKLHKSNNVNILNSTFESSEIDLKKFDYILISGVLHEVDDVDHFFSKLLEASVESVIHINVPNGNSLHRHIGMRMGILRDNLDFSIFNQRYQIMSVFDLPKLRKLVQDHTFTEIDAGYYGFKPFTHMQMDKLMKNSDFGLDVVRAMYSVADIIPEFSTEMFIELRNNR